MKPIDAEHWSSVDEVGELLDQDTSSQVEVGGHEKGCVSPKRSGLDGPIGSEAWVLEGSI